MTAPTRTIPLGTVVVDSGLLMVADPASLKYWIAQDDKAPIAHRFLLGPRQRRDH